MTIRCFCFCGLYELRSPTTHICAIRLYIPQISKLEHNKLIFSKVPTLRFKEFSGEWEKIRLGSIIEEIKNYTSDFNKYPLYSFTIENGVTPKTDRYERNFLVTKDGDTFKIVPPNSFVMNPMNLRFGAINYSKVKIPVSVSGYYNIFEIENGKNNEFWSAYFLTKTAINLYNSVATGSLIEKKRVHFSQFIQLSFFVPSDVEKQKITRFLQLIENRIAVQNKIISKYETLIKGLSCDYFSKQPNHIAKLKDLIIKGKAGGTPSSTVAEYYNGDIPFLSISDMTKQGKYVEFTEKHISENGLANSSAWIVPSNSLILSMYASVGLVCINKVPLATSQAMFSMMLKDCDMLDYIYYYLKFFRETQIHRLLETGTQSNINADTVRDIEIPFYANIFVFVKTLQAIEIRLNNEKDMLSRLMDLKTYLLSSLFI